MAPSGEEKSTIFIIAHTNSRTLSRTFKITGLFKEPLNFKDFSRTVWTVNPANNNSLLTLVCNAILHQHWWNCRQLDISCALHCSRYFISCIAVWWLHCTCNKWFSITQWGKATTFMTITVLDFWLGTGRFTSILSFFTVLVSSKIVLWIVNTYTKIRNEIQSLTRIYA